MFIAVDGIDGAGKTTLIRQLADIFASRNPLCTKEPTEHSEWGRRLRQSATEGRLRPEIELEYFHKDRLAHIEKIIKPALRSGRVVLCDRYVDSTLAFQTDTPAAASKLYERLALEILIPDLTFILDCPVQVGLARINRDRSTTSAFETFATLEKARAIYESRQGQTYAHLDASGTTDATLASALLEIRRRFPGFIGDSFESGATRHSQSHRKGAFAR